MESNRTKWVQTKIRLPSPRISSHPYLSSVRDVFWALLPSTKKCHNIRSRLNYLYGAINHCTGLISLWTSRAVQWGSEPWCPAPSGAGKVPTAAVPGLCGAALLPGSSPVSRTSPGKSRAYLLRLGNERLLITDYLENLAFSTLFKFLCLCKLIILMRFSNYSLPYGIWKVCPLGLSRHLPEALQKY